MRSQLGGRGGGVIQLVFLLNAGSINEHIVADGCQVTPSCSVKHTVFSFPRQASGGRSLRQSRQRKCGPNAHSGWRAAANQSLSSGSGFSMRVIETQQSKLTGDVGPRLRVFSAGNGARFRTSCAPQKQNGSRERATGGKT